jgi:mannitol 2-dehydrogenase
MTTLIPLNRANLPLLPAAVERPKYPLDSVTPGIVHLGLGAFHRAHMARYTHDLMQADPRARRWGIVGAGLMPTDRATCEGLTAQDNLYTLVERQADREAATVIGSICGVEFAADSAAALLRRLDDPNIAIVSLTVTERGYCLNSATKELDPQHPAILSDLENPRAPRSAIGILTEALRRRRASGAGSFTALSCDNITSNGAVLKRAVLALAAMRNRTLADWIQGEVTFPNTMVDRITPITTADNISELQSACGIVDRTPVFCEVFRQWVVEEHFAAGRPGWENVGAQFVPDVLPYELMKLRLLNASHLALAAPAQLAGYRFVAESMQVPLFTAFLKELMDRELQPTLPPVPGIDLEAYKANLFERFANPRIKDTLQRINTDAPLSLLVEPLTDRLTKQQPCRLLTFALAAWIARLWGHDDQRRPVVHQHPQADLLRKLATQNGTDPLPLLSARSFFGNLVDHERFVQHLHRCLQALAARGTLASLTRLLAEE